MTASSSGRGWPLAILAGIVVLALGAALVPVAGAFAEQSDAVAQLQEALARYRALIAARPRLVVEMASVRSRETATAAFLPGDSTALAAANLQGLIKALVERHGGQMRSGETLFSTTTRGLERIQMQYVLSLPLGSLKGALYDLETAAPYLFVDDIEVRPETIAGPTGAPGSLYVQWTVHGYRRTEAP
ncbi:MAG: type II secretion system protein GspM [Rhizomicrobium sp.]